MSQPMLLDDSIDEVESSDEVVEAPVSDEESEEPPSVMEVLLDVDKDRTENVAGAENNGGEAPTE